MASTRQKGHDRARAALRVLRTKSRAAVSRRVLPDTGGCWDSAGTHTHYRWAHGLRPPRCVSTGPVVVRLAGMANEREREREREREIALEVASMQGHCPSSPTSTPLQPPGWAGKKANVRERVLPLTDLALETLAQNPGSIHDLRWTAEHLAIALLERLFARGKLDYRLACVFRDSGHQPIREAIEGLDLLAVCAWPASGPPQERRSS